MSTRNGADNATDRETGQYWENEFCRMSRTLGKVFTPHQLYRTQSAMFYGPLDQFGKSGWTLPDVTIWSAPGEHHEIKHKRRTYDGMYGLEKYRLDALVQFARTTKQLILYTIHDWELAGAGDSQERVANDIRHWLVADVTELAKGCTRQAIDETYYNGELQERATWYWTGDPNRKFRWFSPLAEVWKAEVAA